MDDKIQALLIKLPESLKRSFIKACQNQDTTASRELRDHMRQYVVNNGIKEQ